MRIWSIHPKYLDTKRLVAVWRETLLAKAVLENKTKSYKNHPQLNRFKEQRDSLLFINTYLIHIHEESKNRNYNFNIDLVKGKTTKEKIKVTDQQLIYELNHLRNKLNNPNNLRSIKTIEPHPLFQVVKGPVENWEKIKPINFKTFKDL